MFITDYYCISPQKSFNGDFLAGHIENHYGTRYQVVEPAYGALIPAGLLRRMGKSVRMGVGSGLPLINRNEGISAIILATANGGLEDCLKFLNQIVEYDEGTLTPTNFVQSTPNAIAGNLALMTKNTGYNITHVHEGLAFEAAMLDALLLLNEGETQSILLGCVDEISDYNFNINLLAGAYKAEDSNSETLLTSDSPGTVCGEGAAMFVVESVKTEKSIAQILDVGQVNCSDVDEFWPAINHFLERNSMTASDIDTLVLGYSGDNRTDWWYSKLQKDLFADCQVYSYKNMTGDYPTSFGFALWLSIQIILGKSIPEQMLVSAKSSGNKARNVLIYNHYKGLQHGFTLLKAC